MEIEYQNKKYEIIPGTYTGCGPTFVLWEIKENSTQRRLVIIINKNKNKNKNIFNAIKEKFAFNTVSNINLIKLDLILFNRKHAKILKRFFDHRTKDI